MISINLFGPPRLDQDGAPIHISRRKGLALLSYLAQTNQSVSRETLATLFWPEHNQVEALKSLRRELARLKKETGIESIATTQSQLSLNFNASVNVDVVHFQHQLKLVKEHGHFPGSQCGICLEALTRAVDLYSDDFMAGFNLPDCPEFDTWQDFERESLRQSLGQALQQLTIWHASQREYDHAIKYARRWLALDTLHEAARRALMQVYSDAGRPATALRIYEEGVQLLKGELGISPAEESRRLYQEIRSGRATKVREGAITTVKPARQTKPIQNRRFRSNIPRQPTPFVGRSQELTMIQLRLQEPNCRLLTLAGPGGMGKTRLAIEVGRRIVDENIPIFIDGVFFVPLEAVDTPNGIICAMLDAAGFTLHGNSPREQELLDFLHDKRILFILDNLEHLLESSDIIPNILGIAPGVKILATSRAALRLQEEWFHPLDGLSVPPPGSPTEWSRATGGLATSLRTYDAIRLFEERAQHASPTFSLEEDGEHVVRICRLVSGMPLALELAAGWLKVLDARTVAEELEQSLDLLDSRFRNIPERHQSIRAVFDQTWSMLNPAEQGALARLSVFYGGFTREAAIHVAGITVFMLSALVENSLLHKTTHGRYQLHELLRQFAAKKLKDMGLVEESRSTHCRYYMANLAQREPELKGVQQRIALKQIKSNLDNIRLAWTWALEQDDQDMISQALESIYLYFFVRGRNRDGVDFLQSTYEWLAPRAGERPNAIWGRIVSRVSLMKSYISPGIEIEEEIRVSLAVAKQRQDRAEMAFCHFVQGIFYTLIRNDAVAAIKAYEYARQAYRTLNESFYLVQVLIWMGFCYGNNSRLDEYFTLTHEALNLARTAGHHTSVADALSHMVIGAFCVGEYAKAEQYAQEVGAIGVEFDLLNMIARSKSQLCLASFLRGEIEQSERLAREAHELALEIYQPLSIAYTRNFLWLHAGISGDYLTCKRFGEESIATAVPRFGLILGHWAIAIAYCGLKQDDVVWQHSVAMLELAYPAGFVGMITWLLPVLAIVRARAGQKECAVELLALAQSHPLSPTGWQNKWPLLSDLRRSLEAELGAHAFAAAWERGLALDLDAVVATTLNRQVVATVDSCFSRSKSITSKTAAFRGRQAKQWPQPIQELLPRSGQN